MTVVGLFTAPLRDLVNILDARIKQLEEQGGVEEVSPEAPPAAEAEVAEPATSEETTSPETEQVSGDSEAEQASAEAKEE
jgi:hypothetical protein